jgi:hypothetical protein
MASTELSRKLELRQKTCWLFMQKVMQAMKGSAITSLSIVQQQFKHYLTYEIQ